MITNLNNLDNLDKKLIQDSINSNYSIKSLKNWRSFIRKRVLKQYPITPYPYKITSNNKNYKLLVCENGYEFQIKDIVNNLKFIQNSDLFPKIILNSEKFILVEYVDGNFPNFKDKFFANYIAQTFAYFHKINLNSKKSDIILNYYYNNKNIFEIFEINLNEIENILSRYLPNDLLYSFSYVDHNRGNYIVASQNEIKLIDLGSYLSDSILDVNLLSSVMFKTLDQNEFWKSYKLANGSDYLYENQRILKLIATINTLINSYDRFIKAPKYDLRVKYHKKINYQRAVRQLSLDMQNFK